MRRSSLRSRVTALASVAITIAVALGVLIMYLLQMKSVRATIDSQLRTYATQIEQTAAHGAFPRVLASSTLDSNAEAQVLAADGSVLAATSTLVGRPAIYQLPAGAVTPVRQKAANGVVPTEVRVVAIRATVSGRSVVIVTGTSTDLLRNVNSEFLRHLLWSLPIILILSAGTVWLVVGRALRPVEKIRNAVTAITSADLSQRVPESGSSDEVGRLAHTMNDMLERLDHSSTKQRRFAADASHELRTPLAAIRTTLEVGLAHPDAAPWPAIAERAIAQSGRLEALIRQLLLMAKADEGMLLARQQLVDLHALLSEIVAGIAVDHIDIELTGDTRAEVFGDADHLERLFGNLIDNAIRYARERVDINVKYVADTVVVAIDDDGPGIPTDDRERVFDRFVRLDNSRDRRTGSSGLGLAIALEIATAHNGQIEITDSPTGGARFVVTVPQRLSASQA